MKIFLVLLILIFGIQSLAKADNIRDLEIEGISVGDSLLDFYSVDEINNNIDPNIYKNKDGKFKLVGFYDGDFGEYDGMQFAFKTKDKKFKIYGVNAGIFYSNIDECKTKMMSIRKEISSLFKNAGKNFDVRRAHPADKTKKSYVISNGFFLDKGSDSVKCFDWSDEITKKYGWGDNLRVGIKLKEYNDWLK